MARVGIIEGEKLLIKMGDGESPEEFTHPCLINTTRGINFTTNVTETEVPDCDDPSAPAVIVRTVKSKDFTINGAGKNHKSQTFDYIEWWNSGEIRNVEVEQQGTGAEGGWSGVGPGILKDFAVTGERGDKQEVTLQIVPADEWTWTQNA